MKQCAVSGCQDASRTRGWCSCHYQRWRKHGHPERLLTVHRVCVIEDCEQVPKSTRKGLCEKHRARVRTHGNPYTVTDQHKPIVTYNSMHYRLRRNKGSARNYACIDCNGPALQWSYNHADPEQLTSDEGFPYSLDPSCYDPRCKSCHNRFDLARLASAVA